jgi:hypothetical protein
MVTSADRCLHATRKDLPWVYQHRQCSVIGENWHCSVWIVVRGIMTWTSICFSCLLSPEAPWKVMTLPTFCLFTTTKHSRNLAPKYSKTINGKIMISRVYGSPAAGSPNNWAAIVGWLGGWCAQYLQTGSSNYPPSPSTRLPFSRSMGSPGPTVLLQARPQIVMQ